MRVPHGMRGFDFAAAIWFQKGKPTGHDMTDKPTAEMSFEEAMAALESVVGKLERGDVPLEESIALYQRGAELKAHCAAKLKDAEEKVELIRAAEGRAIGTTPAEGM